MVSGTGGPMSLLLSGCLVGSGEWGVGSGESGIGTTPHFKEDVRQRIFPRAMLVKPRHSVLGQ